MNDVVSLGVGSVAGAAVSELLKVVIDLSKMVAAFKEKYMELASTMEDVRPMIEDIERLQGAGDLKKFMDIINEARVLVRKCSQVKRWNLPARAKYTRRIDSINQRMRDFCQVQVQLIILRNQRVIMSQLLVPCSTLPPSPSHSPSDMLPLHTMKALQSHLQRINKKLDVLSVSPPVYMDLCSVPEIDKVLVGLDLPLMELKKKLLDDDDDDPVVSLVVSAPPGCGKTTLVTQLCHDGEMEEKFEYIFFCDLSKVPTFRTIVQTLLQHNGYEAPTFENDSQAVDSLRNLLEELKEDGPILLVLDAVCQGAESLLQKFQMNIMNFKILVTSRFEFPSFGPTYHLKPLGYEDAKSLLIERASPRFYSIALKHEDLLQMILKRCYGFPLLIEVSGVQLIRKFVNWATREVKSWSEEDTIIDKPQPTVLECLQPSLNGMDPHLKECFSDMGSFLTEGKIRASSIIDIWIELYGKGSTVYVKDLNELAMHNLLKIVPLGRYDHKNISVGCGYMNMFISENLLKLIPPRRNDSKDEFYNDFLVTQHSILRDLAICQSNSEEHQERKRLNLEIREDKFPDWCLDLMQPISARLLSISTDDLFSSTWAEMDCPNVEALVLNLSSSSYALPNFIATMKKLKVVAIINHGLGPAKLTNLSCLSSLPNLKRIIFEKISVTLLDIFLSRLGSLEKLSLFMCSFGEVSYNIEEIAVPEALPSLQEIDIDYCYDLYELPDWVSEVVSLKKLSITNCGKLSALPKAIGNLSNLEVLRLCSCIDLCELPESTERLSDLQFLDISDCLALKKLPLEIGKLRKLEKISMRMCSGCELPDSVRILENLKVYCDEETGLLWKRLKPEMRNLIIIEEYSSLTEKHAMLSRINGF